MMNSYLRRGHTVAIVLVLLVGQFDFAISQDEYVAENDAGEAEYDGYYDISARDTGYLCSLMEEYRRGGEQPNIVLNPPDASFSTDSYLRPEDHKCWRNRWNPCTASDLKKSKPCGWYNMEEIPEENC